jgi:hypothetical protein
MQGSSNLATEDDFLALSSRYTEQPVHKHDASLSILTEETKIDWGGVLDTLQQRFINASHGLIDGQVLAVSFPNDEIYGREWQTDMFRRGT